MKIIEATWRRDGEDFPVIYSMDPSMVRDHGGDLMAAIRDLLLMDSNVDSTDGAELVSCADVTEEVHGHAHEAMAILHRWAAGDRRKEYIGGVIGEEIIQD